MDYIKIDSDQWDDANKVWGVLEYSTRPNSTAVDLVLEDTTTRQTIHRVVANNQIEWLEAKDW